MSTPSLASRSAVVIGGGISGTLSGLHLADAGWDVTILEAKTLGAGSSSRTAGGIRQQFSTPENVLGMMHSVEYYKRLGERLKEPVIRQNGYLFLLGTRGQWRKAKERVAMQHALGLDVEALTPSEVKKRFPYIQPESDRLIRGATWCASDGFLYPAPIYQGAAELAEKAGARVIQNAQVTGADLVNGRIRTVHTTKGDFSADVILDATNAWSNRLARLVGGETLRIDALKRHLWYAPRNGVLSSDVLATLPLIIGPTGVYCRPEGSEQLVYSKLPPHTDPENQFAYEDQDKRNPVFDHEKADNNFDHPLYQAWGELSALIPAFAGLGAPVSTNPGYYGATPDHNPYLDYDPRIANLIRLVGFSGHGAMFGPFTALVALALAEAGRRVDSVRLPNGREVSLAAFRIGREFRHEDLVI